MIEFPDVEMPAHLVGYNELLRQVLPEVAEACRSDIVAQAGRDLVTSGQDYIQSVGILHVKLSATQMRRGQPIFATIILRGWLPNAVEHGWQGGDMKKVLLQARTAKVAADGTRYMVVPFRHGTPGTSGRSFGTMGGPETRHPAIGASDPLSPSQGQALGRRVHRAAQRLQATTSHPEHGTSWGKRLGAATGGSKRLRNQNSGYHHKHDIYEGMVRKEKTYAAATQNQYWTFRAVSENSDPMAWMHPGIRPHGFFKETERRFPKIVKTIMNHAVRGMVSASRAGGA